jgi:hypothetical protein
MYSVTKNSEFHDMLPWYMYDYFIFLYKLLYLYTGVVTEKINKKSQNLKEIEK